MTENKTGGEIIVTSDTTHKLWRHSTTIVRDDLMIQLVTHFNILPGILRVPSFLTRKIWGIMAFIQEEFETGVMI